MENSFPLSVPSNSSDPQPATELARKEKPGELAQSEQSAKSAITELPQFEPLPSGAYAEQPDYGIEIPIPTDIPTDVQQKRHRQRVVLELMIAGFSVRNVAKLTNVSRMTIWRWMKSDPEFQSALATMRDRAAQSARNMLASGVEEAATLMLRRMKAGDLRAAAMILRSAGLLGPPAGNYSASPKRGSRLEVRLRELLLSMESQQADDAKPAVPVALPGAHSDTKMLTAPPMEALEAPC